MFVRHIASAMLFFVLTNCCYAATIVEDVNFALGDSMFGPGYQVTVYKTVIHDIGPGLALFDVEQSAIPGFAKLAFLETDLSTGSDWYRGDLGQLFSAATIASGAFEVWSDSPLDFEKVIEVPLNQDLWFGVNTGRDFSLTSGEPDRDIFGWVQFVIDDNLNVEMVDNAMAFDSGQIILGRNLVPEPSANCIIWLALVALFSRRIYGMNL